jgi:hypothetical protein
MPTKKQIESVGQVLVRVPFDLFGFAVHPEPDILAPYKLVVSWKVGEKNPQIDIYGDDPEPLATNSLRQLDRVSLAEPNFISEQPLGLDGLQISFELSFCAVTDSAGRDCVFNYPDPSSTEKWTIVETVLRVRAEYHCRVCDSTDIDTFRLLGEQSTYRGPDRPPDWLH